MHLHHSELLAPRHGVGVHMLSAGSEKLPYMRAKNPERNPTMTTRHPLDGNAIAADAHYDQPDPIGHEDGETCNRVPEPDEDAPKGYRPKPCQGVMGMTVFEFTSCDTCGEIGD